jgi:hypothetical protein
MRDSGSMLEQLATVIHQGDKSGNDMIVRLAFPLAEADKYFSMGSERFESLMQSLIVAFESNHERKGTCSSTYSAPFVSDRWKSRIESCCPR